MKPLLIVAAIVCFVLAALAYATSVDVDRDLLLALVPAGLAFWAGSSLVP